MFHRRVDGEHVLLVTVGNQSDAQRLNQLYVKGGDPEVLARVAAIEFLV